MKTILDGYDLNRSGQHYDELIKALKAYTLWWHHLDSTWLLKTDSTATEVRDHLRQYLDSNDELLVIDVTNDAAAWSGFKAGGSKWIKDHI